MAKPVSPAINPTFHTSSFSDSEIAVAIQLIHLSEDDFTTTCSGDKSVSSTAGAAGFEDDGSHTSRHRATAATLVEEIFGVGANRRRRKPRSRSVYEIYKVTKPIISGGGGGGIAKRKWNIRNRSRHESEAVAVASGLRDLEMDEACNLWRKNREAEMEYARNRSRRHELEAAVASGLRDLEIDEACNLRRRRNREAEMEYVYLPEMMYRRNRSRHESEA